MTIMATHSSAIVRAETPHITNNSIKRRAQSVIDDKSIDAQSRGLVRYALEINDPWLAEIVRRIDAGETIDTIDFSQIDASEEG
jgi:hypothetical protein